MTATSDDMPADFPEQDVPPRRRRWSRWVLGAAVLVFVALAALWLERKPIAADYIDKTLAAHDVPASYHIADLGLGRQRLTDLVIGDPVHPDLVADWVEMYTRIGLGGARVTGLRAGHVRLRARLIGGHVSLGSIDRLLPAPSGKPFALPALDVAVQDARIRLETPQGLVGVKLSGTGRLDNGFAGRVAAVSDRLDLGGCVATRVAAVAAISIADAQPTVKGPLRAAALDCGATAMRAPRATVDATLGDRLDRWQGKATLALAQVTNGKNAARQLGGTIDFEGSPARTGGTLDLAATDFTVSQAHGTALALNGDYRIEGAFVGFQGNASARGVALPGDVIARVAAAANTGQGTPFAPIARRLSNAAAAAARSSTVAADITALRSNGIGRIGVSRLIVDTRSGARAMLTGGDGIQYSWPQGGIRTDGLLALSGGGLPEAAIRVRQARAGGPITGNAVVQPYIADDARLALTPVAFTANPDGSTRIATRVTLSGPLGDGRLDNASIPLVALWNGAGRLAVNPGCAPLSADRLAVSGLVLDKAALQLCPSDGAMLRINGKSVDGGVRIAASHLNGTLGSSPIALDLSGAALRLGDRRFAVTGLAARLGQPDRVTSLDFAALDGRIDGAAVAGTFTGGSGQIGNVPLDMSAGAGDWTLKRGVLDVHGGITVADTAPAPRFEPLDSHDVALSLANGRITATGTLVNPATGVKVTEVSIVHDLAKGSGHADLAVPGITFDKALQPDKLTPLTFGVIADVNGTVSGDGHIAWTPEGVTSTGTFRTAGTNLAAAFGPVTGLSTEIHFTDLLNMVSAPIQTATVAEINPGVSVDNGVIHYQTLSSTQVKVGGAEWPFAGGQLTLDPTTLDFSQGQARTLTFRVAGMDAAQFLQQFDFKNIDATGTFDGVLPMIFDSDGGRIENGHLTVREGGGQLAYVGDLSQKDLGTWGNMAFQALKSLRYDSLDITMNGPIAGEMVTQVRFAGVKQGAGTRTNFIVRRLMKLPFVFNVTIRAPFRQLLSSAESLYDPSHLPQGKVQELLNQQASPTTPPDKPIQPPESEKMP